MADGLIKIQGSTNVGKCVDAINDNFEYLDGKTLPVKIFWNRQRRILISERTPFQRPLTKPCRPE